MNFEIASKSTEIRANWDVASLYCFSLGEGWRLPTKEELSQIWKLENDFEKNWYWSSTECNRGRDSWGQFFNDTGQEYGYSFYKGNNGGFYVRAIRESK